MAEEQVRFETADDALARVVERQRDEIDGLRAAMRHRAVIEQAKGVLMARSGVDPESAFQHLVAHSQRTNLKVTQVAAAVVARAISDGPVAAATQVTDGQLLAEVTGDGAHRRLVAAAVAVAPDFNELVATVVDHTRRLGVCAGTLALAEPDGALRLVGWHGVESHAVSGWQRIPPGADLPVGAAAETRTTVWLRDADERRERFPGSARFPAHREGCAVFPLVVERQLVGCLGLEWEGTCDLAEEDREHLERVAELCAAPVAVLLRRHEEPLPEVELEPARARWFRSFLDSVPAPTLLLDPELVQGRLVDLVVVFANQAAGDPDVRVRGRLLEWHPELAASGFLEQAGQVLHEGVPVRVGRVVLGGASSPTIELDDVHLARVGTLVTMSWRS